MDGVATIVPSVEIVPDGMVPVLGSREARSKLRGGTLTGRAFRTSPPLPPAPPKAPPRSSDARVPSVKCLDLAVPPPNANSSALLSDKLPPPCVRAELAFEQTSKSSKDGCRIIDPRLLPGGPPGLPPAEGVRLRERPLPPRDGSDRSALLATLAMPGRGGGRLAPPPPEPFRCGANEGCE